MFRGLLFYCRLITCKRYEKGSFDCFLLFQILLCFKPGFYSVLLLTEYEISEEHIAYNLLHTDLPKGG